jgi:pimeloyl-ACP methyl ester carboxylesterase
MICEVLGIPVYYKKYGEGKPIIFIHGWSVDHRLMNGCFEPVFNQLQGYQRIYLDLPGMGRTPSAMWIKNSDNTLKIIIEFINRIIVDKHFLLAGESYGGYLSMGLIFKLGNMIDGVLLLCPMVDSWETISNSKKLPKKNILFRSKSLESEERNNELKAFLDVAVMATPEIFEIFKKDIFTGINIHDKEFLLNYYKGEYNASLEKKIRKVKFDKPACILTGRQDKMVGYSVAYEILDRFPRATFAILDCAGHNLQIENEPMFAQFVKDWIFRIELENRE